MVITIERSQLAVGRDCEKHARFRRAAVSRNMTFSALLCELVDQLINPALPYTEMLAGIAGCQRPIGCQTFALNALLKTHPSANLLNTVRDSFRVKVLEADQ